MLNDIGRRIFLEQPARKYLTPGLALVGARRAFVDNELHKCALVGVCFPGRRFFAGAKPDDHLANPNILPRFQFDVARVAIALVQQAQYRDALRHWRADPGLHRYRRIVRACRCPFGGPRRGLSARFLRGFLSATGGQQSKGECRRKAAQQCHYSPGSHAA